MNRLAFVILAATVFAWVPVFADSIHPTGDATNVTAAIQAAINAAPGGVVTLAAGTYPINKTIEISNGASLVGGGSDRGAVVLSLETTATDLDMQSVLNISSSPNTVVSNLTVTGKKAAHGNTTYGPDVAVKMDSGLLVDCSIEDNKTKNGPRAGGGIRMTGNGTVRNCTITRCEAYNSGGNTGSGEGIWMSAGLVENCKILDNRISYDCKETNPGGAVYIEGTGTLRGCLVAGNKLHHSRQHRLQCPVRHEWTCDRRCQCRGSQQHCLGQPLLQGGHRECQVGESIFFQRNAQEQQLKARHCRWRRQCLR